MPALCFYFQVHQPHRLRHYPFFDIGNSSFYEDHHANKEIVLKVAHKCYLPMNAVLLSLLNQFDGAFKISFSFSGIVIDQFKQYAPEVIESFRKLIDTGHVEVLSETYCHSLSFLYSKEEFREQVRLHTELMEKTFGVHPKVFRNTELIYNNDLAQEIENLGYSAILAEGADHILEWRSPNFLYSPKGCNHLRLLLKNYRLSDDIAFRFSNKGWSGYPLTSEKFAHWVHGLDGSAELINLFMDYETFGEHQWEDTGIFEFMKALPVAILAHPSFSFITPSEAIERFSPAGILDVPDYTSWADAERDLTAWLGNDMQKDAATALYALEDKVKKSNSQDLLNIWRCMQTSDHLYYMCTKWFSDGDVHKYFNPYKTPYDAYCNFMNVLADITFRIADEKAHDDIASSAMAGTAKLKKTKKVAQEKKGVTKSAEEKKMAKILSVEKSNAQAKNITEATQQVKVKQKSVRDSTDKEKAKGKTIKASVSKVKSEQKAEKISAGKTKIKSR